MNRRTVALVSAVAVGTIALTGCSSMAKSATPHGKVVEREEKVNKWGGTDYELEIATDSKTNRKGKVTNKTKKTDVKVNSKEFKNCGLKERFPNCK